MAHYVVAAPGSVLAYLESELRSRLGGPSGVSRDICTGASSDTDGDEQAEQAAELSAVVEGIEGFERDGRHQRLQEEAGASLTPSHYVYVVTGQSWQEQRYVSEDRQGSFAFYTRGASRLAPKLQCQRRPTFSRGASRLLFHCSIASQAHWCIRTRRPRRTQDRVVSKIKIQRQVSLHARSAINEFLIQDETSPALT